jgi:signal transduction histidine kinase/CheY-like chemotaxis protein/CHASE3 domain sensor protein
LPAPQRGRALAIAPTAVLLIASASLVFVSSQRLRASRDLVQRTYELISVAETLRSSFRDAEAGERGHLITARPEELAPYTAAVTRIPDLVARLRQLTASSPGQEKRMQALSEPVETALAAFAATLDEFRSSGLDAARDRMLAEDSRAAMDDIRRTIAEMIVEERTLLNARIAADDETEWRTLMVAIGAMAAALVALAIAQGQLGRRNTQLARAEATAKLKASLLQATLDHTREGIVAFDANGALQALNLRFFHHAGLPRRIAVEELRLEALLAADAARDPPVLQAVRRSEAGAAGEDVMFQGRIGERIVEIGAHPTPDGGVLLSSVDVTRRARAEEVAGQAQKMEAIGHLTGGLAHDFNNLLQVITSNLDLVATRLARDPQAAERLKNALAGAARGAQLTRQLLAFARRQPLEPRVVNLGRLVGDMTSLLRRSLGEPIEIETVVDAGLWNTVVDPAQTENALLNLAINARDAMPDGGKLTIELGNASLNDDYAAQHADVTPGQYVMLAVSDTGTGMPPEVIARAFEPFFTTKPEGKGTGLGLSQIYGFVKQSGGHIKIYSEVGHGTAVKIYLPRTRRAQDWAGTEAAGPIEGGSETILVVEDNAEVRRGAVEVIGSLGYRVLEAGEPVAALTLLASGHAVDLLFSDVVMPGGMTTGELTARARALQPRIAVLFTSGYTENAAIHNGQLNPDVHLLSKPYRREELARKLRSVLVRAARAAQDGSQRRGDGAAAEAAPPRLRVLLVEDDAIVRATTVDMLAELGHAVDEAADAREALARLAAGGLDLLITDLRLPDMRGDALAAECRRRGADLPIIFATGYDSRTAAATVPPGTATVLGKPFVSADLARAIATALAQRPPQPPVASA